MKSILVVEDDPLVRETVVQVLREEGFEAFSATDGSDALDVLRRAKVLPGLVLLDAMMPRMGGDEFLLVIRRAFPTIPVVVMSAHVKGLDHADGFMAKPLHIDALISLAREFCS